MSKVRKDLIKDKKIFLVVGILLVIAILVSLFLFYKEKNTISEEDKISQLTEEYNKNNHNKVEPENNEGNSGVDTNNKEELPNIEGSDQGYYDIDKIEDLTDEKANLEATDFSVFITDKINNDEFDDLYNILNKDYVDIFDYTQEDFEFSYFFNGDINVEVTNVEIPTAKDRMFVTTKIVQKANGAFLIKDFTIFKDGTIADILIKSINDLNYKSNIDNVDYNISKRIDTRLGAIYKIDIVNNSENLIQIKDMLIKNQNVIYSYEIISDNDILESYPGIDFSFMIKLPNNHDIDTLMLKCIDFSGNIIK